jgi:oxygen-dependent protoporphyrinogen oxidase
VTTPSATRRVVVIGGGISGLSAAYTLTQARRGGAPVEVTLIDSAPRLGGVIQSETVEGCHVEAGPDSFLAEKPEAAALARELGLGDLLTGSNDRERRTYILHRGKLSPLPDGLMLLVPTRIWPMVVTPLVPFNSKLAMAGELFTRPRSDGPEDESVANFVTRHFGRAMLENIADPLLAGVYGGDSGRLSMRSVLARFWKMERESGSLTRATLRAMRQRRRQSSSALPLFMTLRGGLSQLTARITSELDPSGILLSRRAQVVERAQGSYRVKLDDGASLDASAVIFALPAHAGSHLISSLNPKLAQLLAEIPYNNAMTVSLGFRSADVAGLPPGFGFLVPAKEKRRLLACTFVDRKFPGSAPEGKSLVRCFMGGSRDPEVLNLSDSEALAIVRRELKEVLALKAEPLFVRLHRWPGSMAQYTVGHEQRLRGIESELEKLPGMYLAGNAYSGIGISDCIRTGRIAAERACGARAAV